MTTKITGTVLAVMLAGVLIAPAQWAQDTKPKPAAADSCCPAPAAQQAAQKGWEEAVGLTADQKRRIADAQNQWQEKTLVASRKLREAQTESQKLMQEATPNTRRVKDALKRVAEAQVDLQVAGMEAKAARMKALTPGQRETLANWQAAGGPPGGACGCGGTKPASSGGCGSGSSGCGGSAQAPAKATGVAAKR